MQVVYAQQYDNVDLICWRFYGYSAGVVERVLAANPELAECGVEIPYGTKVFLPEISSPQQVVETVQLWK